MVYNTNVCSEMEYMHITIVYSRLRSGVRQGGVLSHVVFTVFANLFIDELRASGLGCYIFDIFMGCIMYADDIILLSGSLNDLQSMLSVCENVSSQLLLKFNTNKSKCIAFDQECCVW